MGRNVSLSRNCWRSLKRCHEVRHTNIEAEYKKVSLPHINPMLNLEDSCLFSNLGWIGEDQSVSVAGLTEDLANFPALNTSFSSGDLTELNNCAKDLAKVWSSRAKRKRFVIVGSSNLSIVFAL